jgi:N12 class adenine-specific DNA methylase
MSKISPSSDSSPTLDSGATDSPWRPSWLHWLISALSGTVEIEKQTAWLKQDKERLRQENARLDEIAKQRKERLRRVNEKLDEIDAKYDALRRKSGINSTPPTTTDKN